MSTRQRNLERVRALRHQGMVAAHIIRSTGLRDNTVFRLLAKIDREMERDARRAAKVTRQMERDARRAALEAKRAALHASMAQGGLRDRQQAQILADGQRALKLISQGLKPRDALVLIGGSRARMYRAMNIAIALAPSEPLLT